jgi:hypothetical protein
MRSMRTVTMGTFSYEQGNLNSSLGARGGILNLHGPEFDRKLVGALLGAEHATGIPLWK